VIYLAAGRLSSGSEYAPPKTDPLADICQNEAMEQTVLAKIKMPDDSEEEQFSFVTMGLQAGKMVRMTDALSEPEIRSHLEEAGMPEAEINSRIAHARENPV